MFIDLQDRATPKSCGIMSLKTLLNIRLQWYVSTCFHLWTHLVSNCTEFRKLLFFSQSFAQIINVSWTYMLYKYSILHLHFILNSLRNKIIPHRHVISTAKRRNEPHLPVLLNVEKYFRHWYTWSFFIKCILHPMKPSHRYKAELFSLDGKVFSKIVIANGEANFFMKALLVIIIPDVVPKCRKHLFLVVDKTMMFAELLNQWCNQA